MLLTRLDRRLSVLTDGPLGLPERQQTLRRAIAFSWATIEQPCLCSAKRSRYLSIRATIVGSKCLVGLGVCLLGMGAARDAALLVGAADGTLAALGMTAWPSNARDVEAAKTATQARLTSEEYAQLHAAGRATHVGDALRYAREYALPRSAAQSEPTAFEVLTPREREIAWLLARGQTNRQIADGLVISEQTAETHVQRILGKLQLRSRHQVAEVAELHIPT